MGRGQNVIHVPVDVFAFPSTEASALVATEKVVQPLVFGHRLDNAPRVGVRWRGHGAARRTTTADFLPGPSCSFRDVWRWMKHTSSSPTTYMALLVHGPFLVWPTHLIMALLDLLDGIQGSWYRS